MSSETVEKNFHLPVSLRIRGSVEKVFAAWMNPVEAEQWLCDRLEGEWATGKSVYWNFGDHRQEIRIVASNFAKTQLPRQAPRSAPRHPEN